MNTQNTTAHTPTPFEIRPDGENFAIVRTAGRIGRVATVITEDDARGIVRACNAHGELVAALREIGSAAAADGEDYERLVMRMKRIARAALAKVGGAQ